MALSILIVACTISACKVVRRDSRREYRLPLGGYVAGGGMVVSGTALFSAMGLSRRADSYIFLSGLGLISGGLLTILGSSIFHICEAASADSAPNNGESFALGERVDVPEIATGLFVTRSPNHGDADTWPSNAVLYQACEGQAGHGRCCSVPPGYLSRSEPEAIPRPAILAQDPDCDPAMGKWHKPPEDPAGWRGCSVGFGECNGCCVGGPLSLTYVQAMHACSEGQRLPGKDDFLALLGDCKPFNHAARAVECRACADSPRCRDLFGDDDGRYWTATSSGDRAWVFDLDNGQARLELLSDYFRARCLKDETRGIPPRQ